MTAPYRTKFDLFSFSSAFFNVRPTDSCHSLGLCLWAILWIDLLSDYSAMSSSPLTSTSPIGVWTGDATSIRCGIDSIKESLRDLDRRWFVVATQQGVGLTSQGSAQISEGISGASTTADPNTLPLLALLPPSPPDQLGDPTFRADHRLRYAYVAGAMANGVASVEIVLAMARAGMLGIFGAAGLPTRRVEAALDRIQSELGTGPDALPYGFNLIHSPHEPALENGCVDLYLKRDVHLVEASAFLNLTLPLIRYRVHGIHRDATGAIVTPNRVIGKVSRIEVARRFFAPPPEKFLKQLIESGELTADQAELAKQIPVAQDLTAEADSGGHTDNQPFVTLLPTLMALRDEMQREHNYAQPLRVGAAGGIGTPLAASAAFAMGASYILTGSINQACVESGTSDLVRKMLADTRQADVAMAPAADMFEMGVRLQVLKRGTMFAMRAAKLYEWYRAHESIEALPTPIRAQLEKDYFRAPVEDDHPELAAHHAGGQQRGLCHADNRDR